MSITFSQILDLIDDNCKSNSTSYPVADKTRDINLALDEVFSTIFEVGGTWQFDDSNHTDYAIITTNLVSGQRDYPFTTDEQGNLVLEVLKVFVADEQGNFREVTPVDVPAGSAPSNHYDGLNTGGQPNTYDKLGNGILLDPIPNYNRTKGLKVYISREGSYFTTADTTKKAGFAGIFHEYLALRPSYQYARTNRLDNKNDLKIDMMEMKNAIREYYKAREKDVVKTLKTNRNKSK